MIPYLLLVSMLLSDAAVEAANPTPESFLQNGVTAHRGNSSVYPENTLPAFKSAIELGADWVELDVYRTKDNELVILHDADTRAVGDVNLKVAESTLEELRAVDVACGFRKTHDLTLQECPKHTMPTLTEALILIMTQRRTRLSIQPKADVVAQCVTLVKEMGAQDWIGFNDGDLNKIKMAKELLPQCTIFWDRGPVTTIEDDIQVALEQGFESLVIHFKGITKEKVDAIHKAGLEVGAWTVNDVAEMTRLLNLGVTRFYTDYPEPLLKLKRRR